MDGWLWKWGRQKYEIPLHPDKLLGRRERLTAMDGNGLEKVRYETEYQIKPYTRQPFSIKDFNTSFPACYICVHVCTIQNLITKTDVAYKIKFLAWCDPNNQELLYDLT